MAFGKGKKKAAAEKMTPKPEPKAPAKREMSPEDVALRNALRNSLAGRTISAGQRQRIETRIKALEG